MGAWGEAQGAGDIIMIGDGNGSFAQAMGLTMVGSQFGLGLRSQRYVAVIQDGGVQSLDVGEGRSIEVSSCEAVLEKL